MVKKKKAKGRSAKPSETILVVKGPKGFFVAGNAQPVPAKFTDEIEEYEPQKDDGVTKSKVAYIVTRPSSLAAIIHTGELKPKRRGPQPPPK
jgi:hypothetical protein